MPHRAAGAIPQITAACTAGEAGRSTADVPHHDGNASTPSDAVSDGKTAWKGTVTFSPALVLTRASSFRLSPWLPAFLSLGHGRELEAALARAAPDAKGTVTFSPVYFFTRAGSFRLSPWLPAFLSLGHARELVAVLQFPEVGIDQFPALLAKAVEVLFDV